jgi:phosphopantetheine adenylyltransferase
MNEKYNLLFKTGDAELRALKLTNFKSSSIFPIIELTRGRKSKYDKVGDIEKRIHKLTGIFGDSEVCIDLTTDEELSNMQIENLYDCSNGYQNWVDFLVDLNNRSIFMSIVPVILVDTSDEFIENNIEKQVESLARNFNHIVYRNSINDEGYLEDITIISSIVKKYEKLKFTIVVDCEYVPGGAMQNVLEVLKARISNMNELIQDVNIIVVSTSFPRYVSDVGNDDYDLFQLDELRLFNNISSQNISYGDYGAINPVRTDTITMSRGWIPRIDVPTLEGVFYYRLRKKLYADDYSKTYNAVAKKVIQDEKFPSNMETNWGVRQINLCANGDSPGASPSFWISVRMSIFIEMQLLRISKK